MNQIYKVTVVHDKTNRVQVGSNISGDPVLIAKLLLEGLAVMLGAVGEKLGKNPQETEDYLIKDYWQEIMNSGGYMSTYKEI